MWNAVFQGLIKDLYSENGDDKFLQNAGNHLQDYRLSLPRRLQSIKY